MLSGTRIERAIPLDPAVPKQLLLCQAERHALRSTSSSALCSTRGVYAAEWIKDRLGGKPIESKSIFVNLMEQTRVIQIPGHSLDVSS